MNNARSSRLYGWMLTIIPGACVGGLVAFGLLGGSAFANDKYFQATRKDCSSCHVNVSNNYRQLTRYGAAFWRNRCPGVPGGC